MHCWRKYWRGSGRGQSSLDLSAEVLFSSAFGPVKGITLRHGLREVQPQLLLILCMKPSWVEAGAGSVAFMGKFLSTEQRAVSSTGAVKPHFQLLQQEHSSKSGTNSNLRRPKPHRYSTACTASIPARALVAFMMHVKSQNTWTSSSN